MVDRDGGGGGSPAPRTLPDTLGIAAGTCGLLLFVAGCPGDDVPTGSGTGGDEDMPDGSNPGPGGPGCVERIGGGPPGVLSEEAAASQPGTVERVVVMHGGIEPEEVPAAVRAGGASVPSSLTADGAGVGATTANPHVHERWGESRKLELSYCINFMPGVDAELDANYEMTIRALNATMAEWERVTGANFIHIAEDDTPDEPPSFMPQGEETAVKPECAPGTNAYFGVFSFESGNVQGQTTAIPQGWDDPDLEPLGGGVLSRLLQLNTSLIEGGFGDSYLRLVLRHELGHIMGFVHEEVNLPGQTDDDCTDADPRPLIMPYDAASVMASPDCDGFADAEQLSHGDRLSAFFLQHTPRSRFEARGSGTGYRYAGILGGGSEILWHTDGATAGILWRPQVGPDGIDFTEEPFPYSSPQPPPAGGWFPNESEVVIPLQLTGGPTTFDLLFFGPGPDVADLAILSSGLTTSAIDWSQDWFAVPVVGRFDGQDLDRDVVYLYRPGNDADFAAIATNGSITTLATVPQQSAFAYPLAAPYRGAAHPDDIVWFEPVPGRVTTWRLGSGTFELVDTARRPQAELGLVPGEHIPAIGDFNGDGRADIMWHGVSNLAAGFLDIEDVLWLSTSTANELSFATVRKSVGFSFRPLVGDFDGDGIDDLFWHRSWGLTSAGPVEWTTEPSFVWYFGAAGGHESKPFALDGDHSPYVGDFDADGCHDIAWFDAVGDTMHVWRCLPGVRDFDCGTAVPTPPNHAPVGMHWGF